MYADAKNTAPVTHTNYGLRPVGLWFIGKTLNRDGVINRLEFIRFYFGLVRLFMPARGGVYVKQEFVFGRLSPHGLTPVVCPRDTPWLSWTPYRRSVMEILTNQSMNLFILGLSPSVGYRIVALMLTMIFERFVYGWMSTKCMRIGPFLLF